MVLDGSSGAMNIAPFYTSAKLRGMLRFVRYAGQRGKGKERERERNRERMGGSKEREEKRDIGDERVREGKRRRVK